MSFSSHVDIYSRADPGAAAESVVKDLYAEGNGISIRDSDLFFVGRLDGKVVASVRFCIEDGIPMLRTMRVLRRAQGIGVGRRLLKHFEAYLDEGGIRETYCLPFAHLESFYETIGFELVDESTVPAALQSRLREYRAKGLSVVCMKRP